MNKVIDEAQLLNMVLAMKAQTRERCLVVAISGVKCSGKTTLALDLVDQLQTRSINVAHVAADRWLNPEIEFSEEDAAEIFYNEAYRLEELFELVVAPLKNESSLELAVELLLENTNEPYLHTYSYQNVDVLVLDGVFLFKADLRKYFDLSVWIECPFDTARRRAVLTGKEGLPEEETNYLYETVYEPAMKVHLATDNPAANADAVIDNSN